jgi:hypothetical protein
MQQAIADSTDNYNPEPYSREVVSESKTYESIDGNKKNQPVKPKPKAMMPARD